MDSLVMMLRLEPAGRPFDEEEPLDLQEPVDLAAYVRKEDDPEPGKEVGRRHFKKGTEAQKFMFELLSTKAP